MYIRDYIILILATLKIINKTDVPLFGSIEILIGVICVNGICTGKHKTCQIKLASFMFG